MKSPADFPFERTGQISAAAQVKDEQRLFAFIQVIFIKLKKHQLIRGLYAVCAKPDESLKAGSSPATPAIFIGTIPHDIINGQPLHYRRTDDENFLLDSVGWDEKDDGGVPDKAALWAWKKEGDWVWQFPAQ